MKKPSDFIKHPWSCVFMSNEHESIAVNIMVILKRTGNLWMDSLYTSLIVFVALIEKLEK